MTSRVKPSRSSRSSRRPKRPGGSPSTGRRVRQAALAQVKDKRRGGRREQPGTSL